MPANATVSCFTFKRKKNFKSDESLEVDHNVRVVHDVYLKLMKSLYYENAELTETEEMEKTMLLFGLTTTLEKLMDFSCSLNFTRERMTKRFDVWRRTGK